MDAVRRRARAHNFPKFEVLLYVEETTAAWPLRANWDDQPPKSK